MDQCIFCKSTDSSFSGVEHIIPESLGNQKFVLPAGTVCDSCNNGVLATLDQNLLNFEPIQFARTWLKVPTKAGKLHEMRLGNINMRATGSDKFYAELPKFSKKHIERLPGKSSDEPGVVRFKIKMRGREQTLKETKQLARSLYKIGLEFICYDLGKPEVLKNKYDHIRDFVTGKIDLRSGYIVTRGLVPTPRCNFKHQVYNVLGFGELRVFYFQIFGTVFVFDMDRRIPTDINILNEAGCSILSWTDGEHTIYQSKQNG